MYQQLPPSTDPVPPSTNKYRPLLTQYHHVSTSTAFYWPRAIMYQPVLPSTDPVPTSTNRYRLLLTQYHHISTSTTPYWPSTTKYQPVPTYTVVAWGLQTPAQFTLGLVCYSSYAIKIQPMLQKKKDKVSFARFNSILKQASPSIDTWFAHL